ncbi:MAG: VanW family protein [Clostridia bacterium]|nr:VanW family protein [Clostridia bacterium]
MNQILYNTSKSSFKTKLLIILLITLIGIIVCLSTIFSLTNKDNEAILKNVFVSGVDVSEETKEEAKVLLENNVNKYTKREITLVLDRQEYRVSAEELGFSPENLEAVLDEAYNYGRSDNFLKNNYTILFSNFKNKEIPLNYILEEDKFSNYMNKIVALNESLVMDDTYVLSGDKLVITKGQDGAKIDMATLEEYIVTAIKNDISRVDIPIIESKSEKVDLDKIYAEISVEPQNATFISGEKFEVIPEKNGYDFDLENAKYVYSNHDGSGEIVIELKTVEPEIKVADLDAELFKDTISTFSTSYDQADTNRVQNLKTASERCNGKILYPGDEFSFHKTIGTRTVANGYAVGNSYAGGKVVTSVGGGICQISSTLYNIVLKADLEILERKPHGMIVAYAEPSLDATISEGSIDFRFKNTRKYPIKIFSEVKNGTVTMSILGLKDADEPTIELKSVVLETTPYTTIKQNDSTMKKGTQKVVQEPENGYVSEAYKIVKDANGNVVSETLITKDRYTPINEIIKVGTKVDRPVTPVTPVTPPVVTEPEVPVTPPVEEEPDRELPPGWDSPESPYA